MHKFKFNILILGIFTLLTLPVSCEKDSDFTSINDGQDWQFNDDFTYKEKLLFDTLNFDKVASYDEPDNQIIGQQIYFYPNPVSSIGTFEYPYQNRILNFVIVDENFNQKISYRSGANRVAFNFKSYANGYYRMYYAIQDSLFNIVHKGHDDIKKI